MGQLSLIQQHFVPIISSFLKLSQNIWSLLSIVLISKCTLHCAVLPHFYPLLLHLQFQIGIWEYSEYSGLVPVLQIPLPQTFLTGSGESAVQKIWRIIWGLHPCWSLQIHTSINGGLHRALLSRVLIIHLNSTLASTNRLGEIHYFIKNWLCAQYVYVYVSHVQCLRDKRFGKSTHAHTLRGLKDSCDDSDSNGSYTLTGTDS